MCLCSQPVKWNWKDYILGYGYYKVVKWRWYHYPINYFKYILIFKILNKKNKL